MVIIIVALYSQMKVFFPLCNSGKPEQRAQTIVAISWKALVEGYCLIPSIATCAGMTFSRSLDGGEILSLNAQSSISESNANMQNFILQFNRLTQVPLKSVEKEKKTTTTL